MDRKPKLRVVLNGAPLVGQEFEAVNLAFFIRRGLMPQVEIETLDQRRIRTVVPSVRFLHCQGPSQTEIKCGQALLPVEDSGNRPVGDSTKAWTIWIVA